MLIDARALHVIRTFDGGRLPWKWRNFFRHFLARGKQITFHSWHLLFRWRPRLNASAIRIRLNKEAIWFSPFCIPHISFFSRSIRFFLPFIQTRIREWIRLGEIFCHSVFCYQCYCSINTHASFRTFVEKLSHKIRFIGLLIAHCLVLLYLYDLFVVLFLLISSLIR